MNYTMLGQNLHDIADHAKSYFSKQYGASKFQCESSVQSDLPLKPTWQAELKSGYRLCIEVRESPFSNSLYEFVIRCANQSLPIKLWVAVPQGSSPAFSAELRKAHEVGVGVVQFSDDGSVHEFHPSVALSLFALKKTEHTKVPKGRREEITHAESTFLNGSPDQGCQAVCQALEQVTREIAEYCHTQGWWRQPAGANSRNANFFRRDSWATMLEEFEKHIEVSKVRARSATFSKQAIIKVRSHTEWRNTVSHKPKNFRQLHDRDARLRTMFEATRDVLVEWYAIGKELKLVK